MSRKSLTQQSAELGRRLDAIPDEILEQLRPALIKSAEEVAARMQALVPVDEGNLKASITVTGPNETTPVYAAGGGKRTAGPNQALVTVGNPEVRYGHLVEFGAVQAEAQPFMRPAWRLAKARIERRIQSTITRVIRKLGGKGGSDG